MASEFQDISGILQRCETSEVRDFITSLRERVSDLREENSDLKDEVKSLKEALQNKAKIDYEAPFYWMVEGEKRVGPFCQQCHDTGKDIRLQKSNGPWWECKTCKNVYSESEEKSTDRVAISGSPYVSQF